MFFRVVLIHVLALTLTWAQNPTNAVLTVLSNLKAGWETKDVGRLKTCFHDPSDWQIKTYSETFKYMDTCQVEMVFEEISLSGAYARVSTMVKRTWEMVVGNQRFPQAAQKRIHYFLQYKSNKWGLVGTVDESRVKQTLPLTPGNLSFAAGLVSNSLTNQLALAESDLIKVNGNQKTLRWTANPKAALYTVSIADADLTRNATANLIWKTENAAAPWVILPSAALNSMVLGKVYFFHVFAYDEKKNALSGEIFKIKRTE